MIDYQSRMQLQRQGSGATGSGSFSQSRSSSNGNKTKRTQTSTTSSSTALSVEAQKKWEKQVTKLMRRLTSEELESIHAKVSDGRKRYVPVDAPPTSPTTDNNDDMESILGSGGSSSAGSSENTKKRITPPSKLTIVNLNDSKGEISTRRKPSSTDSYSMNQRNLRHNSPSPTSSLNDAPRDGPPKTNTSEKSDSPYSSKRLATQDPVTLRRRSSLSSTRRANSLNSIQERVDAANRMHITLKDKRDNIDTRDDKEETLNISDRDIVLSREEVTSNGLHCTPIIRCLPPTASEATLTRINQSLLQEKVQKSQLRLVGVLKNREPSSGQKSTKDKKQVRFHSQVGTIKAVKMGENIEYFMTRSPLQESAK